MPDLSAAVKASNMSEADKESILKLLRLTKSSRDMTPAELRQARIAAGLSKENAAKLTRIPVEVIGYYEEGAVELRHNPNTIAAFDRVYSLGGGEGKNERME